jgi:hypothetical protein
MRFVAWRRVKLCYLGVYQGLGLGVRLVPSLAILVSILHSKVVREIDAGQLDSDSDVCMAWLAFILLSCGKGAKNGASSVFGMNRASSVPLLEKFGRWLSPFWMFFGIVVGFALMVLAGRWAGKQNLFAAYKRSYIWISPEGYFYPSLNNLTQLVTHIADRKKILVLVGGDSVLVGVDKKQNGSGRKSCNDF